MNLADAKEQFRSIVERRRDRGLPLDDSTRAAALAELSRTHQLAMRSIDRFTAEHRGRRPRFPGQNTRNGLIGKLDRLYASAKAELGLD